MLVQFAMNKNDAYCQVGDLLGKHGCINTTCFELKYNDPYLSLNRKSKSYIIGKSVVFHYPNLTKLLVLILKGKRVETTEFD